MDLMKGLRDGGAEIALETNGTLSIPSWLVDYFDHVTVSPKGRRGAPASTEHLKFVKANDLKIVVPCPMAVEDLLSLYTGASLYLQPRDDGGDVGAAALDEARLLAARHGGRVSIQVHKLLGLP
jgi:organic radical activating enzyme